MKKVFITGTESFVGRHLVEHMKSSFDLYGCDLKQSPNSRFKKVDISSDNISDIIPNDIDAIIHLAAISSDPFCKDKAIDCFNVNVMGTLRLMEAAREKNCKQFIFSSSEWVYDSFSNNEEKNEESLINIENINSEYALSKLVSESNLRQKYMHGFCDVTVLRFGIIYGPRKTNWSAVEEIFNSVKYSKKIVVGSLKTGRCFIHVSDIAFGIIKSIGLKGFNILNLEGSNILTLGDLIDTSQELLNKSVKVIQNNENEYSLKKISSRKSNDLLDWYPNVSLKEGLIELNKII